MFVCGQVVYQQRDLKCAVFAPFMKGNVNNIFFFFSPAGIRWWGRSWFCFSRGGTMHANRGWVSLFCAVAENECVWESISAPPSGEVTEVTEKLEYFVVNQDWIKHTILHVHFHTILCLYRLCFIYDICLHIQTQSAFMCGTNCTVLSNHTFSFCLDVWGKCL